MILSIALLVAVAKQQGADFRAWGMEAVESVQRDLLMPDGVLYGEDAKPGTGPKKVAFNWGVGVMLQALNAAARIDPRYKPRLRRYVEATRAYWNAAPPVGGYDVLPGQKRPDRYYDDNEWMVLALVETSDRLKSDQILGYARQTFAFALSGEDRRLGGGIYWRESRRESQNTCSNAPAVASALALYRKTHSKTYLSTAKRLYAWTRLHLRDPADGLYWDSLSPSGTIGRDKWSYNSGLMLRDAAELFAATKREDFAQDARRLQVASLKRWVRKDGALSDEGKFIYMLVEAWLVAFRLVPNVDDPRPAIAAGLTYLHTKCRDARGHYASRWDTPVPPTPFSSFALIDQAAAARAFLTNHQSIPRVRGSAHVLVPK